ncbi:MAG: S8 family serine peptidase [Desulfobacteraceae bacterium]|nr:S8 family serine peptidase [Desulfobacteraceae bacterium]
MRHNNLIVLLSLLLIFFIVPNTVWVNAATATEENNNMGKVSKPLNTETKKIISVQKPLNSSFEKKKPGNNSQGANSQGNNSQGNNSQGNNSQGTSSQRNNAQDNNSQVINSLMPLKQERRTLLKDPPKSAVNLQNQKKITKKSRPSSFSYSQAGVFLPGQILLVTKTTATGKRIVREVKKKYDLKILQKYTIKALELQVTKFQTDKEISGIINELKRRPGIVTIQPNYIFKTMSGYTKEPMNKLQGIRKIIKIGPDIPFKGKGVKIAIIDTGVDIQHKDLKGAMAFNSNCLQGSSYKPEIHGTAVAGLIGARKNNFGIVGYAPESKIFSLRACKQISRTQSRGECYSSSIAKALDLAIQKKVHIINMSLGTNVKDKLISKLIYAGSKKGILFVAPAGNNKAVYKLSFPASHPKVISVAGITEKKEFFPNAKVAKRSDFYLPCDNLFSTIPNNKHNFLSGTSLSSAVVSGILALAHEKNKDMIVSQLKLFDGDINKWVNKYLMSKTIATQKKN